MSSLRVKYSSAQYENEISAKLYADSDDIEKMASFWILPVTSLLMSTLIIKGQNLKNSVMVHIHAKFELFTTSSLEIR